jgi:hypothetical protein
MKLNKKDVWAGMYRGVTFEITNWGERIRSFSENWRYTHNWNYYIFIPLDLVKNKDLRQKLIAKRKKTSYGTIYDYDNVPMIHSIDMHGGVTYYDVLAGRKSRIIKIGCDYGHLYDEAWAETVDSVSSDCKKTIDTLKDSGVLYNRCQGNGKIVEEKDGYYTKDKDSFYAASYIGAMTEPQRSNWLKKLVSVDKQND